MLNHCDESKHLLCVNDFSFILYMCFDIMINKILSFILGVISLQYELIVVLEVNKLKLKDYVHTFSKTPYCALQ